MKLLFIILYGLTSICTVGQQVSVSEMISMLDKPAAVIDTILKNKGYKLMQKEIDSVTALFSYSHLERNTEAPTWVRSLTYMDVSIKGTSSRLVTYRTYNRNEYQQKLVYLLSENFKTKNTFEFKDAKHTVYNNDLIDVRVKLINNKLHNKTIRSYEFEVGK